MSAQPGHAPGSVLVRHAEPLVVVRLPAGADLPGWATGETFVCVTATADHTSVLCSALAVPEQAESIGPFVAFEVDLDIDPSHAGLLAALTAPLAEGGIGIYPMSSFNRAWVLVQRAEAARAARLWEAAGFVVRDAGPEGAEQ